MIGQTEVGKYFVSTVFLGIDHGIDPDCLILFETMVFMEGNTIYSVRSSTLEEAERIHVKMCELAQKEFEDESEN